MMIWSRQTLTHRCQWSWSYQWSPPSPPHVNTLPLTTLTLTTCWEHCQHPTLYFIKLSSQTFIHSHVSCHVWLTPGTKEFQSLVSRSQDFLLKLNFHKIESLKCTLSSFINSINININSTSTAHTNINISSMKVSMMVDNKNQAINSWSYHSIGLIFI